MQRSPSQMTTDVLPQNAHLRRLARGHRPRQKSVGVPSVMQASQLMPSSGATSVPSGWQCRVDSFSAEADRALLLVGFAGAFRRSEIVGLDVGDVRFEAEGVVLRLRCSKTNQEGALEEVAGLYGSDPHTCPVRALQTWLGTSGLVSGPL
jgi:integrase